MTLFEIEEELAGLANTLRRQIDMTRERLRRDVPDIDPLAVEDYSGRPMLAPMLTAYADVLCRLIDLKRVRDR